jgi:hypothetical protein
VLHDLRFLYPQHRYDDDDRVVSKIYSSAEEASVTTTTRRSVSLKPSSPEERAWIRGNQMFWAAIIPLSAAREGHSLVCYQDILKDPWPLD